MFSFVVLVARALSLALVVVVGLCGCSQVSGD